MRLRHVSVALLAAPFVAFACSTSSGPSTFSGDTDAGGPLTDADNDTATFQFDTGPGDAPRDAVSTCSPQSVPGFNPTWQAPGVTKAACTGTQLTGYSDACLAQPLDPNKCTAFKTANAACTACVETDDTAAKLGPIVWHRTRTYFTVNIAGCIAIEQNDTTQFSCGAAYQAAVSCKEKACDSCFSIDVPSFDAFTACEKNAGTVCQSFDNSEQTTCTGLHDAGAPTNTCFPGTGEGTVQLFARIAPLFCG
jgi:hypothetical protein